MPVSVTIRHSDIGDLTVALFTPTRCVFTRHSRSNASTDDIVKTCSLDLSGEVFKRHLDPALDRSRTSGHRADACVRVWPRDRLRSAAMKPSSTACRAQKT
jgi:hypothetical protein